MKPTKIYSCPAFRDCIGNGKKFSCIFAVRATKANGRKEFKETPACFRSFRREK